MKITWVNHKEHPTLLWYAWVVQGGKDWEYWFFANDQIGAPEGSD